MRVTSACGVYISRHDKGVLKIKKMPQAARWVGSPSIKGKTESMRMALLTFSLLGLQYV